MKIILMFFCIVIMLLSGCLGDLRAPKHVAAKEFCPEYEKDNSFVWANYYCPTEGGTRTGYDNQKFREFNCIQKEGGYSCFYVS